MLNTVLKKACYHQDINGNAGINSPGYDGVGLFVGLPQGQTENYTLWVDGDTYTAGEYFYTSDLTSKSNIQSIDSSIEKLSSIQGISFQWDEEKVAKGSDTRRHMGVIAQEVETVFPELVREDFDGKKAVNYSGLIPVLLEAIKEQQSQIESLEQRIADLEQQSH